MKSFLLALLMGTVLIFAGCNQVKVASKNPPITFPNQETLMDNEVEYAEPFSEGPVELPVIKGPDSLPPAF